MDLAAKNDPRVSHSIDRYDPELLTQKPTALVAVWTIALCIESEVLLALISNFHFDLLSR